MLKPRTVSIALLVLTALIEPVGAKVVTEVVDLAVEAKDVQGQTVKHSIKLTVMRDDARPASGFLVLNHGRGGTPEINASRSVAPYFANARYFVSKGYAVFMPVRIGYGNTGGPDIEDSGDCNLKNYPPGFEAAAAQTLSVIAYAKTLSYIDPANGLVVGQSYGGTTAMAIAAKNVAGVKGAVNFAGGGGGRPVSKPGEPCGANRLTDLFKSYGVTARIPTLWLYSENDRYWGPDLPRSWHKEFVGAGGIGEFAALPAYKEDGHPTFTGNPEAWKPKFEAFLQSCCEPSRSDRTALPTAQQLPIETHDVFTKALQSWADKHAVKSASIVVRRGGRVVHAAAIGGADPKAPVLLASLSKAITGACIATLVRDNKLTLETPLGKALAKFFKAHGRPLDRRIERITIAQLLAHRSGLPGADDGEDPATKSALDAYIKDHSVREPAGPSYLSSVLARGVVRDPGSQFSYSNGGYLALGSVIEEASGRPYEAHCREAVLVPVGATGALDPVWKVMGAYGGWRMSGAEYLKVFEKLDPANTQFGLAVKDWSLDKTGKTVGDAKGQNWYGLGLRLRDTKQGIVVSHTGSWRRQLPPDAVGPRATETSTLAFRVPDGASWFVHSLPLREGGARVELNAALLEAYSSIKSWP